MTAPQLVERLGDWFAVEVAGRGPGDAASVWSDMEAEASQGTLGLYTAQDQQWVIARITQRGRRRMAEVAADHSSAWQGLGVAILHRLVIDTLLDAPRLPNPRYVHLVDEVVHGLTHGDDDGSEFPLAALVTPATVDHVREISEQGERMPAKSTYFYPKLLSGLVINPLDGD